MNDYPVQVGSMLFTLVDPHRGHEVAYNRWYERDHFYAGCLIGPWLFAGRRWVATRALKDLRFPTDSPVAVPVDAGSYLAVYWVHEGHHDEHFGWAIEQVQHLYRDGRGFAERTHVHTVLADRPWAVYRDPDPVPLELALDHGYGGLVTVALDRSEGVAAATLDDYLTSDALPALMAGSPIAIASSWRPIPRDGVTSAAPMDLGSPTGGDERSLQLLFVEGDPAGAWDRVHAYADQVTGSGLASIVLAAPFLPTLVGTDTYTDQLW